ELVDLVLILGNRPVLHRFSISDVPHVDIVRLQALTIATRRLLGEHDEMVVRGEQIGNRDRERHFRKFHELAEERERLILSVVRSRDYVATTDGPADIR